MSKTYKPGHQPNPRPFCHFCKEKTKCCVWHLLLCCSCCLGVAGHARVSQYSLLVSQTHVFFFVAGEQCEICASITLPYSDGGSLAATSPQPTPCRLLDNYHGDCYTFTAPAGTLTARISAEYSTYIEVSNANCSTCEGEDSTQVVLDLASSGDYIVVASQLSTSFGPYSLDISVVPLPSSSYSSSRSSSHSQSLSSSSDSSSFSQSSSSSQSLSSSDSIPLSSSGSQSLSSQSSLNSISLSASVSRSSSGSQSSSVSLSSHSVSLYSSQASPFSESSSESVSQSEPLSSSSSFSAPGSVPQGESESTSVSESPSLSESLSPSHWKSQSASISPLPSDSSSQSNSVSFSASSSLLKSNSKSFSLSQSISSQPMSDSESTSSSQSESQSTSTSTYPSTSSSPADVSQPSSSSAASSVMWSSSVMSTSGSSKEKISGGWWVLLSFGFVFVFGGCAFGAYITHMWCRARKNKSLHKSLELNDLQP
ncbi:hypothetical protein Pelo_16896 [Pelomyxa schiedti]|nr:hypothetical protein Pelo_16896 [Pelomyxa schiedti]